MNIPVSIDRSRIWIALCAAAMCAECMFLSGQGISFYLLLLVFFLTWSAYLFLDGKEIKAKKVLISIALTGTFLFIPFTPVVYWWILLPCGLIVLFYHKHAFGPLPFSIPFDLRSHPVMKTVAIATSWTLLTSVLPVWKDIVQSDFTSTCLVVSNFFFVAALSLAEDICDARYDNNKTIATWMGISRAKVLAGIHMALACLFFLMFESFRIHTVTISFLVVMSLITIFIITRRSESKSLWNPIWIDGMFVVRCLVLWIASH